MYIAKLFVTYFSKISALSSFSSISTLITSSYRYRSLLLCYTVDPNSKGAADQTANALADIRLRCHAPYRCGGTIS